MSPASSEAHQMNSFATLHRLLKPSSQKPARFSSTQYVLVPYTSLWYIFFFNKAASTFCSRTSSCTHLREFIAAYKRVLAAGHIRQSLPPHFSSSLCFTGAWNTVDYVWDKPQSSSYYCRKMRELSVKMTSRDSMPGNLPRHKRQKSTLNRVNIRTEEDGGESQMRLFWITKLT